MKRGYIKYRLSYNKGSEIYAYISRSNWQPNYNGKEVYNFRDSNGSVILVYIYLNKKHKPLMYRWYDAILGDDTF